MEKTSARVERALRGAIIANELPPGSLLPGERELAARYGVTRPIVREALQRLSQDGWVTISQRKAPVVNDFWLSGNLNTLSAIAENIAFIPLQLVEQLLRFRAVNAPEYAADAIRNGAPALIGQLAKACAAPDETDSLVKLDWELHRTMALLSGNRIYPLMLNSFASLYQAMAVGYFASQECREASRAYYRAFLLAAVDGDAKKGGELTRQAMVESIELWHKLMPDQGEQR